MWRVRGCPAPAARDPQPPRRLRAADNLAAPFPDPNRHMIVRTLFFASYRDLAGADELEVELPAEASVADLVRQLRDGGGGWSALPAAPAVAVNCDYAPLSTPLRDGDEVAFIPPVSGG